MTLVKAGVGLVLGGIMLAVFGSRAEVQAINQALTRRLKAAIGLVLAGIAVILVGLRWEGQNVVRAIKRRYRSQIEDVKRRLR